MDRFNMLILSEKKFHSELHGFSERFCNHEIKNNDQGNERRDA